MNEYIIFVLLFVLGLFLIYNGRKSLKKLKEYNQQWQKISMNYQLNKNSNNLHINMIFDDIKNMNSFQEKTEKLNATKDEVFFTKKYQDDYIIIEKIVKKLQKVIPFSSYFSISSGLICCISYFLWLDKDLNINMQWGIIFVILLGLAISLTGGNAPLKNLFLTKRYYLCCYYFVNNDYKNVFQLFLEDKNDYNNDDIRYETDDIIARTISLTLFYSGFILFALSMALDKSFYAFLFS